MEKKKRSPFAVPLQSTKGSQRTLKGSQKHLIFHHSLWTISLKTKSACLLNILTKQNTLTKTVFTFQQGAQSIFLKDAHKKIMK